MKETGLSLRSPAAAWSAKCPACGTEDQRFWVEKRSETQQLREASGKLPAVTW